MLGANNIEQNTLMSISVRFGINQFAEGLPPEAYSIWESYPWRFGKAFCIIKTQFVEMTSYATVLTITAFTIERYVAICKPLKSHKFVAFSRCIKIIIAIWILSFFSALPYPIHTDLFYYVKDKHGVPIEQSLQCNIPPKYSDRMTHVFQVSTFVFFVFPLTVIIVFYTLIGCTLRKAELSRESSDKRHQGSCRNGTDGHSAVARRSVLKVLVAVVVAFFVCWAPFHAQRLLTVYNRDWTPILFDLQSSLFYISGILYFFGSTINPILYNVMSRRYRLAFLETICHSRSTARGIDSQGQKSWKKPSSLKVSLKYSSFNTYNTSRSLKHSTYIKTVKNHVTFRSMDNVGKPNEIRKEATAAFGRAVSLNDEKLINGIHSHEIGHQEIFQAESKHALRCMAENGHVCNHACVMTSNRPTISTVHETTE
ncbi:neuromedin U receptor [Mactra antiquata]